MFQPTVLIIYSANSMITGYQNILEARYLVVNRLASKCIQRHGLDGLALPAMSSFAELACGTQYLGGWVKIHQRSLKA